MKKLVLLTVLAGFIGFFSVSIVKAEASKDPNAPKVPAVRGKVVVEKDAGGVITSVKIESKRFGAYNVVLDAKGKELGEKMAGKIVVVKGVESTKDGAKWVTVEAYKEIQRVQPKKPDGKEKDGKGKK